MNTLPIHHSSTTLSFSSPDDQQAIADEFRFRWDKAQEGLRNIVYFGALMINAEKMFTQIKRRGTGFRGWLAEHCPEINYKTAMGFKTAALGVIKIQQLAEDQPLLELMNEPAAESPEADDVRTQIFQTIQDSSLRLLKEAGRLDPGNRGGKRDGAGRKKNETVIITEYDSIKTEAFAPFRDLVQFVWGGGIDKLYKEDAVVFCGKLRELLQKAEEVADKAEPAPMQRIQIGA